MTDAHRPGLVVWAMGVAVGIPTATSELTARLRHQWQRALAAPDTPPEVTVAAPPTDEPDRHDYLVTAEVTLAALERTVSQRVSLHAAGLATGEGSVLGLVAPSGTGKTTAVLALGRQLGYVTDETVSIAADFSVLPYAKPLSLLDPRRPAAAKHQRSPDDLGLADPPADLRLHRLVVLHRDPATTTPGLRPVSLAQALVTLVPQTSGLAGAPAPLQRLASVVDHCGGVHLLEYAEITDHLPELLALLDQPTPSPSRRTVISGADHSPPETGSSGSIRRARFVEAVDCDAELVVFAGDHAYALNQLGRTVWLAAGEASSPAAILAAAQATHGPHPQAETLVEQAISTLTDAGLLVDERQGPTDPRQ